MLWPPHAQPRGVGREHMHPLLPLSSARMASSGPQGTHGEPKAGVSILLLQYWHFLLS